MTVVDHAQLRKTAQAFAALARRRRTRRLNVDQLIEHQRLAAQLCALTETPDIDQAWRRAWQLLTDLPESPAEDQTVAGVAPVDGAATNSRTPRASSACGVCGQPLGKRDRKAGIHRGCQLVACPGCQELFPQRTLLKERCLPCAAKAAGNAIPARGMAPFTAEQLAALRRAEAQRTAAHQAAHRRTAPHSTGRDTTSADRPARRRRRVATPADIPPRPMWFGRIVSWSTSSERTLRRGRYAGVEYVMEGVGLMAAARRGVAAGWYLRHPGTEWDQLGDYLAENADLATRLAEVLIVTGCTGPSDPDQPPNLMAVMHGDVMSRLLVGGTATSVVIVPDVDQPIIRVHRHAPLSDPHRGAGGLLGEIRVAIHQTARVRTTPVILKWTVRTASGKAVGSHASWDDAYAALAALLEGTTTREVVKDAKCTRCGNHGAHLCGTEWRLANGQVVKRPRGRGSVHTVTGGLPSLGRH